MTNAPERIALRWEKGAAVTNGPLMEHPDYTQFVRDDIHKAEIARLTRERDAAEAAALERARNDIADYPRVAPDATEAAHYDEQIEHSQRIIDNIPRDTSALTAMLAEAEARGRAQGEAAALERASVTVWNDNEPKSPFDDYGWQRADNSDRHADACSDYALWQASEAIRALPRDTSALDAVVAERTKETLQARVQSWMDACFGSEISADRLERGDRLLEEVFELLQSGEYPRDRIATLEDYVWSREVGEPHQEVGGVMITLAAYCLAHGLDMHKAGADELARVWTKIEKIRAKHSAKPKGSALPQVVRPSEPSDRAALAKLDRAE